MDIILLAIICICSIAAIAFACLGFFLSLNNKNNELLIRNCDLVDQVNELEKKLSCIYDFEKDEYKINEVRISGKNFKDLKVHREYYLRYRSNGQCYLVESHPLKPASTNLK